MITPGLIIDIGELFAKQFGSNPYKVPGASDQKTTEGEAYLISTGATKAEKEFTAKGSLIREKYLGVEIFLPIRLYEGNRELMYLPYCVVRVTGKNSWVSTPMIERKGSTHELYTSDDYKISIKGFIIGADGKFPEDQLQLLADVKDKKTSLVLDNALTNIFLTDASLPPDEQRRVIVIDLDLPEVQGGRENVRPFVLQLESDFIQTLELL